MRASVERGLGIALFVLSGACSGGPSGSASGTDNGSGDSSGTSGTTAAATSGSDATGSDGGTNTGSSSTSGSGTSGSTSSGSTAGESGSGSSGTGGRGVCGDEVLDPGEACDDGVFGSVTCDPDCTPASCGDGTVNEVAGESCDDGNAVTEDGCEPDCTFTTGIKSLVGSSDHFCANNFAGEVQCWGISFNGWGIAGIGPLRVEGWLT